MKTNYQLQQKETNSLKSCYLHLESNGGFTLVELLAVMAIFITIGIFVSSIIVATLRGNNKTNALATVQTNGTFALTAMVRLIRTARALDSSVACGSIANPVSVSSLAIKSVDGSITTFSCVTSGNTKYLASNSALLTDPNLVKWSTCKFTCGRNSISDYPVIGIDFSLNYISPGSSNFTEQTASSSAVNFQSSVIMRNMER